MSSNKEKNILSIKNQKYENIEHIIGGGSQDNAFKPVFIIKYYELAERHFLMSADVFIMIFYIPHRDNFPNALHLLLL